MPVLFVLIRVGTPCPTLFRSERDPRSHLRKSTSLPPLTPPFATCATSRAAATHRRARRRTNAGACWSAPCSPPSERCDGLGGAARRAPPRPPLSPVLLP